MAYGKSEEYNSTLLQSLQKDSLNFQIVLLKYTNIHGITKVFVFFFSTIVLLLTGLSRFTDLTPSSFEVLLYFLYQLGITIGILAGTIRKIKPQKFELK